MTKSKKNSDSDESNPPKKSKNSVKPTDSRKVNVKSGKTTGNSKNTNVKSGKTNANSKNTNAKSGKAKSKKSVEESEDDFISSITKSRLSTTAKNESDDEDNAISED